MSERIKKGKVWIWGIVGTVVGFCCGGALYGVAQGMGLGSLHRTNYYLSIPLEIVGAVLVGWLAYSGSKKNNGAPPAWLWRSKKKDTVK